MKVKITAAMIAAIVVVSLSSCSLRIGGRGGGHGRGHSYVQPNTGHELNTTLNSPNNQPDRAVVE